MPKITDVNFYNLASAKQLGWEPEWFNCHSFDSTLVDAIKRFQKANGLVVDGLCGPMTYRLKFTERQSRRPIEFPANPPAEIACGGTMVPIKWEKFVGLTAPNNLAAPEGTYVKVVSYRKPTLFVVHWDATLSSAMCATILKKRNLSIHFMIDNDGTIYQACDCNNSAQHAGNLNMNSIGVEITNAVYPKYQANYVAQGLGKRPLISGPNYCHGRNYSPILGFYPVQEQALEALLEAVCGHYGIPLETPTKDGKPVMAVYPDAVKKKFKGVVSHFHLDREKYDACCIDLVELLDKIKKQ